MDIKEYAYVAQEALLNEVLDEERKQIVITFEDYQKNSEDFDGLLQMKKDIAILRMERHLEKLKNIVRFWHILGIVAIIISLLLFLTILLLRLAL